jgi:hypothetical protein
MVSASFWGTFEFDEGLSFELFEPSLNGSLRYRKSDSHGAVATLSNGKFAL